MVDHSSPDIGFGGADHDGQDASTIENFHTASKRILNNIDSVIDGKPEATKMALIVLLAEGHLLIEDVPGVGKTVLAKALAKSVDCSVRRVQFTPDLLPSDITGVSAYNQAAGEFEFKPGAVFANVVIGDEINRASPKTQSALLEAMEERQVTVDGTTHVLSPPFTVVATQNPLEEIAPVVSVPEVMAMIDLVRGLHIAPSVEQYCVDLVQATRRDGELRLGASPRATLQLVRAAKVLAALEGREYVLPDDIRHLLLPVLSHRIIPTRRARGAQDRNGAIAVGEVLNRIIADTVIPDGAVEPD